MSIDRNKLRRYRVYDRCFSDFRVKYTRSRLLAAVNEALLRADLTPVSASTVNHDISENGNFVSDMCPDVEVVAYKDIHAGADKVESTYYRYARKGYSIWKVDLDEEQLSKLQTSLVMLRHFRGLPDMDWVDDLLENLGNRYQLNLVDSDPIVELDQNADLSGIAEFFSPILNAIAGHQALSVNYKKAFVNEVQDTIHPYYLKEYNTRWFLLAWSDQNNTLSTFAIDRLTKVEPSTVVYRKNTDIDFESFFDDIIGVTHTDAEEQLIRLRFTPNRYPYVMTKPLHWSQHNYDESREITIQVIPNRELESLLLSFGPDVEILEPASLREQMKEKIAKMMTLY